jgi:hypothetical protein
MSVDQFLLSGDTTDLNYPEIRPTLDLNFARTKTLDPRITFTRASGGSYVGADGFIKYAGVNEARFDHDPETGESLGLLIENGRTNGVLWSSNFENPYWLKQELKIVPNAIIAPDGSMTGQFIAPTTTFSTHAFRKPGTTGDSRWISMYVKYAGWRYITILTDAGTGGVAVYDLLTGRGNTSTSISISPAGNGWFRITRRNGVTSNIVVAFTDTFSSNYNDQNSGATPGWQGKPTTGDGVSGIYAWGFQEETSGDFFTSYIPTQGSTRTRVNDFATISDSNFSSWYNQNGGTIVCEANGTSSESAAIPRVYWELNRNSSSFRITNAYNNSESVRLDNINNTIIQAILRAFGTSHTENGAKFSSTFKNNYFRLAVNGSTPLSSNSGSLPTVDRLFLGHSAAGGSFRLNGTISRFTYYPKILSDSQLISLTR